MVQQLAVGLRLSLTDTFRGRPQEGQSTMLGRPFLMPQGRAHRARVLPGRDLQALASRIILGRALGLARVQAIS